jgi:small subunit ribosomal protein S1
VKNLGALVGQTIRAKVIKLNRRRGNVVLSRRIVLEEEREEKKKHTLAVLSEGMALTGTVKNITDYGAFIDLGGIDGLLHVTDMSWGRIGHPSEIFQVGDQVEVVVLHFDRETGRVSLGYKQKSLDPWATVDERYPVGGKVAGRVVSLTNYGAFIELEPGVEGLVHVSEMSWTRRVRHPSKLVNVGDTVEVQVLDVNKATKRISLGMKQVESDPWSSIDERYKPGLRVQGKVRNLTDFGAFVELEPGVDGLLHISQMSSRPIGSPAEIVNVGDELTLLVIRVDPNERRIGLSLKELAAAILEEPQQQDARGRGKGRKRRGGDDFDDED